MEEMPSNYVHIVGRCMRSADANKIREGLSALNFSLAVPDFGNDRDVFVDCIAYGEAVEDLEGFVSEGETLHIEGHLSFRSFTDTRGFRRTGRVVIVDKVHDEQDTEE